MSRSGEVSVSVVIVAFLILFSPVLIGAVLVVAGAIGDSPRVAPLVFVGVGAGVLVVGRLGLPVSCVPAMAGPLDRDAP